MTILDSEEKLQIQQLMKNLHRAKLTWIASVTKIDLDLICENVKETGFYIDQDELVNPKFDEEELDEVELKALEITKEESKNRRALRQRLDRLERILTRRAKTSLILGIISLTSIIVLIMGYAFAIEIIVEIFTDIYFLAITHGIVFGALSVDEREQAKIGIILNSIALLPVLAFRIWLLVVYFTV